MCGDGLQVKDPKSLLALVLTLLGIVLGIGRWVGKMETRIEQLENKDRFIHGTYTVPER